MDYEDEFDIDQSDVDIDVDIDDEFNRRYRLEDSKMLTQSKSRRRRGVDDNTLTTMSYKGTQVLLKLAASYTF